MGASRDDFVKYPRTPHLFGSKGTDDDKHLGEAESVEFIACAANRCPLPVLRTTAWRCSRRTPDATSGPFPSRPPSSWQRPERFRRCVAIRLGPRRTPPHPP